MDIHIHAGPDKWLGYQDSNLGMRRSKPRALPLGDSPKIKSILHTVILRKISISPVHLAMATDSSLYLNTFATCLVRNQMLVAPILLNQTVQIHKHLYLLI